MRSEPSPGSVDVLAKSRNYYNLQHLDGDMEHAASRGSFSGRLGFILAAAGSAVGLGNLWRFPYLAEHYGGGAFLVTYIILVVTFGVALMITEIAIGRRTGKSCIDAFLDLGEKYKVVGWIIAIIPLIIVPYYCVIGGWVTKYFVEYMAGMGSELANGSFFGDFMSASMTGVFDSPVTWFAIYAVLTVAVVAFGVQKGVERMSKILLPGLLVLLVGICLYMLTVDGISEGLSYYIVPNFDDFSMKTVLGAMGQLFYSLSLAMGIMITYGSYMRKNVDIEKSAYTICLMDTCVAFLSGLMIVPAVVVFIGPGMGDGFGLMFETMPLVFETMPAGHIVGAVFFLLAMFAAWTSSISLSETAVSIFRDRWNWRRSVACIACLVLIFGLGILSCLGFGPLSGITILGMTFLEFFDFITNSVLMPIAAIVTCIIIGYFVKTKFVTEEVESSGRFRLKPIYNALVMVVCPLFMAIILVTGLLDYFGIYTI